MIEVRFHREVYDVAAVDESVELYRPHADVAVRDDGAYRVVAITAAAGPARERRVAGELMNYALGSTVKRRGGAA